MQKSILAIMILAILNSCGEQPMNTNIASTSEIESFKESILLGQSFELSQQDDSLGEWGGNRVIIQIKKMPKEKELCADIKKIKGTKEPPPPSHSPLLQAYYERLISQESSCIPLDKNQVDLAYRAILELTKHKLNDPIPQFSQFGLINFITNKDSTFIIHDHSSIKWSNFQALKKSLNIK
ncbi:MULTISPECIES: hypothetical protein [unclassified Arenibacter]|uniref:hypothetical protein n=1 Tax=unclassified Arenibacter TaxID=2615047 RepID=UPI0011C17DBD|nr:MULTISPECIES: hypothetical protein [unclassified Arenibacter]MCM4165972.1 hypothetical protein [Arenibacter sp. A80]